ncbi:MAG: LEA type 2 family protein [Bacteroidota bacterium]
MIKIKYFVILLLIITILFVGCKIQEVNIGDVQGIKFKELNKQAVNLEIQMPIENPNNFKFSITKVDLDIAINKSELGKVKKIKKIVIPANSNEIHSFLIEVEYKKLMAGTVSIIGGLLKNKTEFKIDGYIKVRAFGFVSKKIKIHENNSVKLFDKK